MLVSKKNVKSISNFTENLYDFIDSFKSKKYKANDTVTILEHVENLIESADDTTEETQGNKSLNEYRKIVTRIRNTLKGIRTGYSKDILVYADLISIVKRTLVPELKNLTNLLNSISESPSQPTHKSPEKNSNLSDALEQASQKIYQAENEKALKLEEFRNKNNEKVKILISRYERRVPSSLPTGKNITIVELPVIPMFKNWKLNREDCPKRAKIRYEKLMMGEIITERRKSAFEPGKSRLTGDYILVLMNQKILCFSQDIKYDINEFLDTVNERSGENYRFVLSHTNRSPKNGKLQMMWIMEKRKFDAYAQSMRVDGVWSLPWGFVKNL